jgi:SH3 domain protein
MIIKNNLFLQFVLICCLFVLPMQSQAETRYVTDEFEITLRTGPSSGHTILRTINSGTALTVLERDADNGHTRVQTAAGTEGWVLTRYLMVEPAARDQLISLSKNLADSADKDGTRTRINAIKKVLEAALKHAQTLELENEKLTNDVIAVKDVAANVLEIDQQNQIFRQELVDVNAQMKALSQENYELSHGKNRDWFVAGALVLFAGLVIGLLLTRIQWQKRSRYDGF